MGIAGALRAAIASVKRDIDIVVTDYQYRKWRDEDSHPRPHKHRPGHKRMGTYALSNAIACTRHDILTLGDKVTLLEETIAPLEDMLARGVRLERNRHHQLAGLHAHRAHLQRLWALLDGLQNLARVNETLLEEMISAERR